MLEVLLPIQQEANGKQRKEENRLVELRRVHLMRHTGELNSQKAVRRLAVAAAREEATHSPEGVRNQNAAGKEGNDVNQAGFELLSKNEIDDEECDNSADKPTDEGNASPQIEARRRVFDIVIGSLEKRRRAKAQRNGGYAVVEGKIDKTFFDFFLFAKPKQQSEAYENADGYHQSVHIENTEDFLR